MHIQVINFHLADLSDTDYRAACDELAPAFADAPGLLTKVWLANPATNTYGGVYTWESREAMEEFGTSELFHAVATNPSLADISSADFDVIESPTGVTRGLVAIRA